MEEPSEVAREVLAGIDIGGTKIAALLVLPDGDVVARGVVAAPSREGGPAMADAGGLSCPYKMMYIMLLCRRAGVRQGGGAASRHTRHASFLPHP